MNHPSFASLWLFLLSTVAFPTTTAFVPTSWTTTRRRPTNTAASSTRPYNHHNNMPRTLLLRTFSSSSSLSLTSENSSMTSPDESSHLDSSPQQEPQPQQHLVLIGGGHAHAQVIKALHQKARPAHLKVTLIDPLAAATYSGMVPGAIAGLYDQVSDTHIDIKSLAQWAGMDFVQDRVVDMDLDQKLIYTRHAEHPIPYDAVSVDIGSTTRDVDVVPGARQYSIPTRPIDALVRRLQQRKAEQELNEQQPTRIVVVGGGVAGIELSMAVQAQFSTRDKNDDANNRSVQTTLLTASDSLLPEANPAQRQALYAALEQQGVQVLHQAAVAQVEEDAVILGNNGGIVPFDHCLWATGAAAHPLAFHLQQRRGLSCTTHGWIEVDATLQSTSHAGVFAAGDCAHILSPRSGAPPPKAGVYAVRAGPVLVENLTRYLSNQQQQQAQQPQRKHEPIQPLEQETQLALQTYQPQDDFLKLLVCSRTQALGLRFGLALYGRWVLQVKHAIDVQFMNLFRDLPVDVSYMERGVYDTSQYDTSVTETDPLRYVSLPATPADAAALLQRTDDGVDWKQAWLVLRTMTNDLVYRQQVLEHTDVGASSSSPSKQVPSQYVERSEDLLAQAQ